MNIFLQLLLSGGALFAATGAGFVLADTRFGERLRERARSLLRRAPHPAEHPAEQYAHGVDSLVVSQVVARADGSPSAGVPANRRLSDHHESPAARPGTHPSEFRLNQYDQRLSADEKRSRRAHPSAAWRRCSHVARASAARRSCLRPAARRAYPAVVCETHWVRTPAEARQRVHQWISGRLLSPEWSTNRAADPPADGRYPDLGGEPQAA